MNADTERSRHRPEYGVTPVTAFFGMTAVFAFGFLTGRIMDPVPGMPAGVPALAWVAFVLLVGALLTPVVMTATCGRRLKPRVEPATSKEGLDVDAALDFFPAEQPVSESPEQDGPSETPGPRLVKIAS